MLLTSVCLFQSSDKLQMLLFAAAGRYEGNEWEVFLKGEKSVVSLHLFLDYVDVPKKEDIPAGILSAKGDSKTCKTCLKNVQSQGNTSLLHRMFSTTTAS